MKLTVPIIPYVFSNLFDAGSISRIGIHSGYDVNLNIQPEQTVTTPQKCTYGYNYNVNFNYTFTSAGIKTEKNTVIPKNSFLFPLLRYDNTINAAGFTNYKYRLPNICGRKFFRTQLSKTSAKLPSLTTGICFVRVKIKVTGEATYLQCVKI